MNVGYSFPPATISREQSGCSARQVADSSWLRTRFTACVRTAQLLEPHDASALGSGRRDALVQSTVDDRLGVWAGPVAKEPFTEFGWDGDEFAI